ncbi:uncharacterized protein [Choristoneura fumiferana]|uniref:uncharacterized protein n=1 Tax=Choristoneura fumiferana TaxID=7141 RepID=UPI003D15EA52
MINKYDDNKKHPKCKVSLNDRLGHDKVTINDEKEGIRFAEFDDTKRGNTLNLRIDLGSDAVEVNKVGDEPLDLTRKLEQGNLSSRSSLYSIPSIEWDGRCKSEYAYRTQSLPRNRNKTTNLFRTRSYSGFANSYIKDPEPNHFHVPKCRSCGSSTNSYVWELTKEKKSQKAHSVYFSVDNIHQECNKDEIRDVVKIKENIVPVFKVAEIQDEFVESQEFTEDNYLTDLNSFSSENQTVIENDDNDVTVTEANVVDDSRVDQNNDADLYKAEIVHVQEENSDDNDDTNEGEYHSFSDEMGFEEAYESPVKDLVEKDIRDYSVPINFYCEDYKKKESPKKSPKKIIEVVKQNLILEPILEESKSSYDDSSSFNNDKNSKRESGIVDLSEDNVDTNCEVSNTCNIKCNQDTEDLEHQIIETTYVDGKRGIDKDIRHENHINTEDTTCDELTAQVVTALQNEKSALEDENVLNDTSTDNKDFESAEHVFKIPEPISRRDSTKESNHDEYKERHSNEYSIASSTELLSFDSTAEFEKYEVITDLLTMILNSIDIKAGTDYFENNNYFVKESNVPEFECTQAPNVSEADVSDLANNITEENFSITQIIQNIEGTTNFNDTVLTEISDIDSQSYKVAEAIIYFIFNKACFLGANKHKVKTRNIKKVVTIVDNEDILGTAMNLWHDVDNSNKQINNEEKDNNEQIQENNGNEDLFNITETGQRNENINVNFECSDKNEETANFGYEMINELLDNVLFLKNDPQSSEIKITNDVKINTNETLALKGYDNVSGNSTDENCESSIQKGACTETDTIENLFQYLNEEIEQKESEDNEKICNRFDDGFLFDDNNIQLNVGTQIDVNISVIELETEINNNVMYENVDEKCINDEFNNSMETDTDNALNETVLDPQYIPDTMKSENSNETFVVMSEESSNETYIVTNMNTAFVQEDYFSRSSSPHREKSTFEACTESPINHQSELYEKEDSILGSPFVKKANVIAMSQTEHRGGVKYWLSFDDSLTETRPYKAVRRYTDNTVPSFLTIDLDNEFHERDHFKRTGLLLDEYEKVNESNVGLEESFVSAKGVSDTFDTCDSEENEPKKMLLYDSRPVLHTQVNKRLYSSWPPFEDTLFYKIISKFRMSESFDPSEYEHMEDFNETF